jgi:RNA polymerase sigma-70 factor (ECF subfamily)
MEHMETFSDERLMAAAQAGDAAAYEVLRARHLARVYRLCWSLLGNSAEAQDATQDSFVRAWLRRCSYRNGSPFAPWLYRIARNACLDRLRHARFEAGWDAEEMTRVPCPSPTPEQAVLRVEEREALRDCLSRLEPHDRAVVNGFYVGDEEVRGVVIEGLMRRLGLGRRTVYDRLNKALGRLRACLGAKGITEPC